MSRRYLTEQEKQYIIENYGVTKLSVMMEKLDMSREKIQAAASNLRKIGNEIKQYSKAPPRWTEKEEKFLIKNYKDMSFDELEKKLNKTQGSIRGKINKLRIRGDIKEYRNEGTKVQQWNNEGINLRDVKVNLKMGQAYKIQAARNELRKTYRDYMVGTIIQETQRCVTLKTKIGYCETFLKLDFLIGEYKAVEYC